MLRKIAKQDNSKLPKLKIALVGDTATQLLVTALRGIGVERCYNIDLFEAEYNQVERQFMDPTSELYEFDADFIAPPMEGAPADMSTYEEYIDELLEEK